MKNNILLTICALVSINSLAMMPDNDLHLELELPKAAGMRSGIMVISDKEFPAFDKYFSKINALPKAQISYDIDNINFGYSVLSNEVALVAINDSCLAKPNSGIEMISLDNLQDCVGLFIFQDQVGTAAAHIALGTKLSSLDQLIKPFKNKNNVHITLLSSWKTNTLNKVMRFISENGLLVESVFVNNVVQQMNSDGTMIKRYLNPSDFLQDQMRHNLRNAKTNTSLLEFMNKVGESVSSPVGAVISTSTGKISFIKVSNQPNAPHVSSGVIRNLRESMQKLPSWMGLRYKNEVQPYEDKLDVDIAFVQYPVSGL